MFKQLSVTGHVFGVLEKVHDKTLKTVNSFFSEFHKEDAPFSPQSVKHDMTLSYNDSEQNKFKL